MPVARAPWRSATRTRTCSPYLEVFIVLFIFWVVSMSISTAVRLGIFAFHVHSRITGSRTAVFCFRASASGGLCPPLLFLLLLKPRDPRINLVQRVDVRPRIHSAAARVRRGRIAAGLVARFCRDRVAAVRCGRVALRGRERKPGGVEDRAADERRAPGFLEPDGLDDSLLARLDLADGPGGKSPIGPIHVGRKMAEADGNRTRRTRIPGPYGFEDRARHQTRNASGNNLAAPA